MLPPGWTELPPPEPWSKLVALDDGRIVQIGERRAPSRLFDPASGCWDDVAQPEVTNAHERAYVVTAEGWIHASGGAIGSGAFDPIATCELFDPATRAWLAMPPLPEPCCSHACVSARGRIWALGGKVKHGSWGTAVDTLAVRSWAAGEPAWRREPDLPFRIEQIRALVLDDDSIVVWGWARQAARWDHEQWSALDPIASSAAVAPLRGGGLIACGGSASDEAIATVRAWSPARGWTDRAALPKPRKNARAVQLADGRIAVVGGVATTKSWEDTSSGGELDIEYRSFMAWVVKDVAHADVVVEEGNGWRSVPAPVVSWGRPHALLDGRVLVLGTPLYMWTPP